MHTGGGFFFGTICGVLLAAAPAAASGVSWSTMARRDIEADWFRQLAVSRKAVRPAGAVRPEEDASGGCDGVVNGAWGFHTASEKDPWWQVDLGRVVSLGRAVLYNRTELAGRASRVILSVSPDGKRFEKVYQHDGTVFLGHADGKPLVIGLANAAARYVRLQLPATTYFHLDEVEVYAAGGRENLALGRAATQSSTSQWSVRHTRDAGAPSRDETAAVIRRGLRLAASLRRLGVDAAGSRDGLREIQDRLVRLSRDAPAPERRKMYTEARWIARRLAFANPLLDFDSVLFVKRAPGTLPHMSDQYYGWWSRPGGGIYLLEGLRSGSPRLRCLTESWAPGSFLRPDLSRDGRRVLFAYARHHPDVARMEKVEKERLPEDGFYHIYEMRLDGTGARRLTRGRYDDFDARYLPRGDIVFLSTRKGRFLRCGRESAMATTHATLPDSYVRCGGDNVRPCAVFTLHRMDADGRGLCAISAFENFEWTPSIAADGRILYARWDYIDRFNGHFMSLWSTNPDGTNPNLVYGNFTASPQSIFEARSIPGSRKLIFTASAHHSITGGSLVLLDPAAGTEGALPLTRLTPEVCFPESEGWPQSYYANPYPLSEEFYLVAWGDRRLPPHAGSRQVADDRNPVNALGLYLYDTSGNLELIYRDPRISSMYPLPVRPRPAPPVYARREDPRGEREGAFFLQDVYVGLRGVKRGSVTRLRVVGVPPKIQPHMNSPRIGISREDPGKFILGTVPVEKDGSAHFLAPSGVPLFFQALDADGLALQTMRTLTYVQPGQTLSCIGCHEPRGTAPPVKARPLASTRPPSRLKPGPDGTWPLRFDVLVQPVLDRCCVDCHREGSGDPRASRCDLTSQRSYDSLVSFAGKDLERLAFEKDRSDVGDCPARRSKLLSILQGGTGHENLRLDGEDMERILTWMDVYAQKQGSFGKSQEEELRRFRRELKPILAE